MKIKNLVLLPTFSLILLACSKNDSAPASGGGADPAVRTAVTASCGEFIKSLPADYFKDWVTVPEDPKDPSSTKIKVFYYGKISNSDNVVVFYNGGPGSSSQGSYRLLAEETKTRKLEDKISFVYIDQRGNGCSDGYPLGSDPGTLKRLTNYGSTGIVEDSEAVRKVLLGDKPWKVFGQSYGAFIVHRYAVLYPQSIVKAYAHANVINASSEERHYYRIASQVRVLEMYLAKYPEDREKLKALKDYLTLDVCFKGQKSESCGREIPEDMVYWLGFADKWDTLHTWIGKMVVNKQVQRSALQEYFDKYLDDDSWKLKGKSGAVLGYWDRNVTFNYDSCKKAYARLAADGFPQDKILMSECESTLQYSGGGTGLDLRGILGTERDILTLEKFKDGLKKMKANTFYLYSGEKDCFVPKESFAEELAAVKNLLNYTHFMNTGHDGFHTEDQVWNDLIN